MQFDATVVLFARIAGGVAIAGTLAAGAVAWMLMNRLLGPVEQLSLAAADAADGDLGQRIRLDGPDAESSHCDACGVRVLLVEDEL